MKRIIKFILLFLIMPSCNYAQDGDLKIQVDHAQFEIIKKTIEFLCLDKETFDKVPDKNYDKKEGDYTELKKFYEGMEGVPDLIDKYRKPIQADAKTYRSSLNSLIKDITKYITTAEKDPDKTRKANRKKNSKYNDYKGSLNKLVNSIKVASEPAKSPKDTSAKVQATPNKKDTAGGADTTTLKGKVIDPTLPLPSKFDYLPYCIAGVFLILLILSLSSLFKIKGERNQWKAEAERLKEEKKMINERQSVQQNELKDQLESSKKLNEKLKEDLLIAQTRVIQKPDSTSPAFNDPGPLNNNAGSNTQPPANPVTVKYAIYADQGDGFSPSELRDNGNNDTIFEIRIKSPATAEFQVSNNLNAQKSALIDPSLFLSKTCNYDGSPARNSTIKTDAPGELKLQGNKWLIVTQAKISFT